MLSWSYMDIQTPMTYWNHIQLQKLFLSTKFKISEDKYGITNKPETLVNFQDNSISGIINCCYNIKLQNNYEVLQKVQDPTASLIRYWKNLIDKFYLKFNISVFLIK